jgi:hypothetical protein
MRRLFYVELEEIESCPVLPVLKGALMFRAWDAPASRPTREIDLLA